MKKLLGLVFLLPFVATAQPSSGQGPFPIGGGAGGTVVQTNFNSGFVYTNASTSTLLADVSIAWAGGSTVTICRMDAYEYPTNGGATIDLPLLRYQAAAVAIGTNTFSFFVPPNYGYVLTNLCSSGPTATIVWGQLTTMGVGPTGPQGAQGVSGYVLATNLATANQVLDPFGNSVLTPTGTNQINNTNVIYGYGFTVGNGMTGADLNFNNPLYIYNPPGSSYPAYTNGTFGEMVYYDGTYNAAYVASNSLSPPPWTLGGQDRYSNGSTTPVSSWSPDTGSGGPTGMGFNYGTNYVSTYKITVITATNISIVEAPGVISQSATNAPFSVVNTNGNGGSPQIVLADFHANVWYSANQNQSSLQVQNLGVFVDSAFNAIGPTPGWGNNGMAGVPATPMGGTMFDCVPDVKISYQSYYGGIAGQTAWSSTNNLIDFVGLNMDDSGQSSNPNVCATNWIAWNNGNIWATGFGVHTNMLGVGSFWAWYNITNYLMTWGGFCITDWTNSAGAPALAVFGENTGSPATFTKALTLDLSGNMSILGSYSGNGSGVTNLPITSLKTNGIGNNIDPGYPEWSGGAWTMGTGGGTTVLKQILPCIPYNGSTVNSGANYFSLGATAPNATGEIYASAPLPFSCTFTNLTVYEVNSGATFMGAGTNMFVAIRINLTNALSCLLLGNGTASSYNITNSAAGSVYFAGGTNVVDVIVSNTTSGSSTAMGRSGVFVGLTGINQ